MQIKAESLAEYVAQLPEERKNVIEQLHKVITENLPVGYEVATSYGMISYVVPHSLYPKGYHCDPKLPLPFIGLASQKNFVAIYHMGIYADAELLKWFQTEFAKVIKTKLDMGKSCIRFKNMSQIPYALIGELASKMSVENWISLYETAFKK
jgi:hypothetical protein